MSEEPKIIGGFYIYRVNPDPNKSVAINELKHEELNGKFQQETEITGIVVVKKTKNNETIFIYLPINATNFNDVSRKVRSFISSDILDTISDENNVYAYDRLNDIVTKQFIQEVV